MAFSKEEFEEVKEQLLEQVENLPNENKEQIKKYIKGLDEKGLEEFLKKNNIQIGRDNELVQEKSSDSNKEQKCIFCEIINNKIPSYRVAENDKAMAILEINPLSRAHSIIVPLEHKSIEKLPKSALSLAQKLAKKIKKKFKPEDIKIETSSLMGHAIINIVPMYKDTPLKKFQAQEEELKKVQKKLETKTRAKRKQIKQENVPVSNNKNSEHTTHREDISRLPKINFRIP